MSNGLLIFHGLSLSYVNLGVFYLSEARYMNDWWERLHAVHQNLWLIVSANHFPSRNKVAFALRL